MPAWRKWPIRSLEGRSLHFPGVPDGRGKANLELRATGLPVAARTLLAPGLQDDLSGAIPLPCESPPLLLALSSSSSWGFLGLQTTSHLPSPMSFPKNQTDPSASVRCLLQRAAQARSMPDPRMCQSWPRGPSGSACDICLSPGHHGVTRSASEGPRGQRDSDTPPGKVAGVWGAELLRAVSCDCYGVSMTRQV